MSLLSRIRGWLDAGTDNSPTGVSDTDAPDTHSTTGTTPNDTFVGQASGDDPGDVESPAQLRAERPPDSPGTTGKRAADREPSAEGTRPESGGVDDDGT